MTLGLPRMEIDGALRTKLATLAAKLELARLTVNGELVAQTHAPVIRWAGADVTPPPGGFLQADARSGSRHCNDLVVAKLSARPSASPISSPAAAPSPSRSARTSAVAAFDSEADAIAALTDSRAQRAGPEAHHRRAPRPLPPPAAGARTRRLRRRRHRPAARRRQGADANNRRRSKVRRDRRGLLQPRDLRPRRAHADRRRLRAHARDPDRPIPLVAAYRTGGDIRAELTRGKHPRPHRLSLEPDRARRLVRRPSHLGEPPRASARPSPKKASRSNTTTRTATCSWAKCRRCSNAIGRTSKPASTPRPQRSTAGAIKTLERSLDFLRDVPQVARRRRDHVHDEVLSDEARENFPRYYLQNFHYQSGGWLTEDSAKLYDFQVETLFAGTADAMRRQALVPIAEYMKGRDQRRLERPRRGDRHRPLPHLRERQLAETSHHGARPLARLSRRSARRRSNPGAT